MRRLAFFVCAGLVLAPLPTSAATALAEAMVSFEVFVVDGTSATPDPLKTLEILDVEEHKSFRSKGPAETSGYTHFQHRPEGPAGPFQLSNTINESIAYGSVTAASAAGPMTTVKELTKSSAYASINRKLTFANASSTIMNVALNIDYTFEASGTMSGGGVCCTKIKAEGLAWFDVDSYNTNTGDLLEHLGGDRGYAKAHYGFFRNRPYVEDIGSGTIPVLLSLNPGESIDLRLRSSAYGRNSYIIPLPASAFLLISGLAGLLGVRRFGRALA